jgi:hypothetical protein
LADCESVRSGIFTLSEGFIGLKPERRIDTHTQSSGDVGILIK